MEKNRAEESPFSKFTHVGVVVRDMDKAIEHLSSLGIGPFEPFRHSLPLTERIFRGKPTDATVKISIAKIGQVALELIQPVEGQSAHKEFLDRKGEGIQHIAFVVDDLDKEIAKLAKRGVNVLWSGRWQGGGFAYLETDAIGGIIVELTQ
jgi:catechol 2,3-dioxygenase-like lactoylglutathione lyase family enzyme